MQRASDVIIACVRFFSKKEFTHEPLDLTRPRER